MSPSRLLSTVSCLCLFKYLPPCLSCVVPLFLSLSVSVPTSLCPSVPSSRSCSSCGSPSSLVDTLHPSFNFSKGLSPPTPVFLLFLPRYLSLSLFHLRLHLFFPLSSPPSPEVSSPTSPLRPTLRVPGGSGETQTRTVQVSCVGGVRRGTRDAGRWTQGRPDGGHRVDRGVSYVGR